MASGSGASRVITVSVAGTSAAGNSVSLAAQVNADGTFAATGSAAAALPALVSGVAISGLVSLSLNTSASQVTLGATHIPASQMSATLGSLIDPSTAPTPATAAPGGPTTYYYKYSGFTAIGETQASPASTGVAPSGSLSANPVTLTLTPVAGALGYRIYRGTAAAGPFNLVGSSTGPA